jgi:hypothetical protein
MRSYFFLAIMLGLLGLTGCASTDQQTKEEKVSELPWNTPQKWEGGGAGMGGGAVGY